MGLRAPAFGGRRTTSPLGHGGLWGKAVPGPDGLGYQRPIEPTRTRAGRSVTRAMQSSGMIRPVRNF
jgi:hypothetical protein